VGRDKGSFTEQQTEGNRNNNGTNKQKTQQEPYDPDSRSPEEDRCHAPPSRECLPAVPPPTGTKRDGTGYGIPGSGQVGSAPTPRLCPFLESGEN